MSVFGVGYRLPRHTRGYLWIGFLVAVFMVMLLSENGVSLPRSAFSDSLQPSGIPLTPLRLSSASTASVSYVKGTAAESKFRIAGDESEESQIVSTGLDPKDVVILVKTGATSIWRRMPGHMSTTLGNSKITPNVLYYSDAEDNINGNPVIDVLANVSTSLKASPDFVLYNRVREIKDNNLYQEAGAMEGDFYLPGGWRLDKYKFLPMFQHAAAAMPGKKWYIYLEDDNYYFWETLYAWLSTLNHTSPVMVGSPAFRLGEDFAHGGSGFAISGKAMSDTFGKDKNLANHWEDYAREQCCGDQVLSHVMRSLGVSRDQSLSGGNWAPLQALPTWRIGFGTWNWCSPIMNIHKVHQADISRLYAFEKQFKSKTGGKTRMRYKDIFRAFAERHMSLSNGTRSEWDNYASTKQFSSSDDSDVSDRQSRLSASQVAKKPWYSREACKKACKEWDECLSWRYADDSCSLGHTAAMGQRIDAGIRMESGWMLDRIAKLEGMRCEDLSF